MRTTKTMAILIDRLARETGTDLDKLGAHVRIENSPYMPLSIECVGYNLVSVTHYYEQNGDLVPDPDMMFYTGYGLLGGWVPVSIQMNTGYYQRGALITDGKLVAFYPRPNTEQTQFANMWARNLREQGFIAAAQKLAYSEAKQH